MRVFVTRSRPNEHRCAAIFTFDFRRRRGNDTDEALPKFCMKLIRRRLLPDTCGVSGRQIIRPTIRTSTQWAYSFSCARERIAL